MDKNLPSPAFALPSPSFKAPEKSTKNLPHFLSPNGIQQLSRNQQPPPMYGPRGATIPPKHFNEYGKGPKEQPKQQKEYCEACDWEFNSLAALKSHEAEHEVCAVEGCNFKAITKIVDKHIEMAHKTGLFDQIKKLDSPEEIAKWREARKKRYPTVQNVQLRQQMQKEKFQRGEKLEPRKNRFGKNNDRTQGPQNSSNSNNFNNSKKRPNQNCDKSAKVRKVDSQKKSPVKRDITSKETEKMQDSRYVNYI